MLKKLVAGLLALSSLAAPLAMAENYEVSITNLTKGQTFTPRLFVTHSSSGSLFEVGQPASAELEVLAEGGDTAPLAAAVAGVTHQTVSTEGLLAPGQTETVNISSPQRGVISMAAMLIPTNDSFVAMDSIALPESGEVVVYLLAYDAGTEANDQSCQNIPGPRCGGEGHSPEPAEGDEGYVYISNGFHALGDVDSSGFEVLSPAQYDWRNFVAKVTIKPGLNW